MSNTDDLTYNDEQNQLINTGYDPYADKRPPEYEEDDQIRFPSVSSLVSGVLWKAIGPWHKAALFMHQYAPKFGGDENFIRALHITWGRFRKRGGFLHDFIVNRICEAYGIEPKTFFNSNKRHDITSARRLYVALIHEFEYANDKQLSKPFGRKRDFAKRERAKFRQAINASFDSLGPVDKKIITTYMAIRNEIKAKEGK